MQPSISEKRKYERYNICLPVHYALRGYHKFGNTVTKNLSEEGTSLVLEEFIPPATDIFLELNVSSKVVSALGKVRWAQRLPYSDRYQIGVQFSEIDKLEKKDISQYITTYQTTS